MRENADDSLSKDRAEAARCIHGVLNKFVWSAPVPFAHKFWRNVRLVDFNAYDERDVRAVVGFCGKEGTKRWAVLDGSCRKGVHVCVEAAVVP